MLSALKIYTPHGRTRVPLDGLEVLDLGSGARKLPGSVGLDRLALPGVDIVHDLNDRPWPIPDKRFDVVYANHSLEHSTDVLKTLGEIHRILRPGGHAVIQVPYFRALDAFADPTHTHFFTSGTLDYVCEGTGSSKYKYVSYRFKKLGFWYGWPATSQNPLARFFKRFIYAYPGFYDQYLSLLFPVSCLTWELEALSDS